MSLSSILLLCVVAYVVWGALLFFMQRGMMYPGATMVHAAAYPAPPPGVEAVRLPFADGTAEGWLVPSSKSQRSPAIIFAHGNAEIIDYTLREALALSDLGAAVLLVEYPGYRGSDGSPSRESIGEVFQAAYDLLAARPDIDSQRIAGFGRSLGSGAIGDLSLRRDLKALVLQSPYASIAEFARGYLLPSFLVRDDFDNISALRAFDAPVLLVHGRRDEVIPFSHSEQLASATSSAELVALNCGHNDCPPDWEAYIHLLDDFLSRAGILSDRPTD